MTNSKENLKTAIELFDRTANLLIQKLSLKYNLDLSETHPFRKLITRQNDLWKGTLEDHWNYQFHGDACKFINSKSGQILDVKINRKGNYGTISNFYLLKFIETTMELQVAFNSILTETKLSELLIELKSDGVLTDGKYFNDLILKKSN